MSTRRRLLLALLSAVKWVVNRFTYIYNSIVPSGDYKKARLGKIEGNGEIVNQLVSDSATSYTFNDTNKYLKRISGTYSLYTGVAGTTISVSGGSDMVCDLTKEFGTGNEPTSLTDNRIKRIIAKGYIPYNNGTYESSVVKEIEYSRLPDEYQEVECLESHGTEYIDTNLKLIDFDTLESKFSVNTAVSGVRSACGTRNQNNIAFTFIRFDSNYFAPYFGVSMETNILFSAYDKHKIKVKATNGEQTVYVDDILVATRQDSLDKTGNNNVWFFGFNNNGVISTSTMPIRAEETKFISGNTLIRDFVPCYRKSDNVAGLYDLVNNVFYTNQGTGTFAVGNDIPSNKLQLPQPIKLNGNTTDNDSFAITSSAYVFTRKVWGTDNTTFPTTLQTPQVISIPKKHLGCVRLKDLSWTYWSQQSCFRTTSLNSLIKRVNNSEIMSAFCSLYQTTSWNDKSNLSVFMYWDGSSQYVCIKNTLYTTPTNFINSLTDNEILFYETRNEVQDFTNSLDIQSGGFLNAKQLLDEVCEVLPNVELEMRK